MYILPVVTASSCFLCSLGGFSFLKKIIACHCDWLLLTLWFFMCVAHHCVPLHVHPLVCTNALDTHSFISSYHLNKTYRFDKMFDGSYHALDLYPLGPCMVSFGTTKELVLNFHHFTCRDLKALATMAHILHAARETTLQRLQC